MSMSLIRNATLFSTLLLASAQMSSIPRRLRRGNVAAVARENENSMIIREEKEFGRQRQLEDMSMSTPIDLIPSGFEVSSMDFSDADESIVTGEPTGSPTYYPSYYPTYYPTSSHTTVSERYSFV